MNTFPRAEHSNASPLRGLTLTYEFEDSTSNTWILWGAFKPQRVSINILAGFGFLALVGISKILLAPGAQDHSEMWDFSHTSPVIVVEPQLWAQGCPYTPSETWQRAQDDSREEGLEGSLLQGDGTRSSHDPSQQELNLVTFFPEWGRSPLPTGRHGPLWPS